MKKLLKEPLLHFLALGCLLYITSAFVKPESDVNKEIVVDNSTVGRLVSQYMIQTGMAPDKKQLDELIDNDIKEEIEYREAIRMGLDQDDEIIRRRLSQKVEFLVTDLVVVPEPSSAQLQEYYTLNSNLFKDSSTVTFTHIYFNGDHHNDREISERAKEILTTLNQKKVVRAPEYGDRFALQYDYHGIDQLEAEQLFGTTPLASSLFTMPEQEWTGPFKSGYGWHLVYLQKKKNGRILPFEEVREDVRDRYITSVRQQENEKQWENMKDKYTITRKYLKTDDK